MPSPFQILSVPISEFAAELAQLETTAFASNELIECAFGVQASSPAEDAARLRARELELAKVPPGTTVRFTKAVDANGVAVGAAMWEFETQKPVETLAMRIERETEGGTKSRWPASACERLCEEVLARGDENRERFAGHRPSAALRLLAVLPSHQRQGIGGALLKEGLQVVDEMKLPMWLGASQEGLGLYLKHGFLVDERWDVDLTKYGGSRVESHACMHREARKSS